VLAVALLLGLPWAATRYLRTPSAPVNASVHVQPPHSIAVLPLIDVTPGDGNGYLGDGLAQELSARLGRIHGLRVASSTSAFSFRNREADVRAIAQTLGVRQVLEGSVMRVGDQLRVTAQLIDADSGYNVWSQTYNRTWQDLVAIQDDVVRSIIGTLKVVLASDMAQRAAQPRRSTSRRSIYTWRGSRSCAARPVRCSSSRPRTRSARRSRLIRSSRSPTPGCASAMPPATTRLGIRRW
jgi:TolB-like protein